VLGLDCDCEDTLGLDCEFMLGLDCELLPELTEP
jgi:hypothetical protein